MFSVAIELIQLITVRGTFELDDIFDNTLGAVIGWLLTRFVFDRVKVGETLKVAAGAASIIGLTVVILFNPDSSPNIPRLLYFQVEEKDGDILEGTAFRYELDTPQGYRILLKSTSDRKEKELLNVEYGLDSTSEAEYYGDAYNHAGFRAEAVIYQEYEFILVFNPLLKIPTGVYISPSSGVHYVKEANLVTPDLDTDFINKGVLLSYRPDYHCWVYQYNNSLYWVAEPGFNFEDDGTTYIQYHLWTTKTDKLPEKRLANNWLWDNIGGYCEQDEVIGPRFGDYRVSKRDLPTEYPITSIKTGYYKNKMWVWEEYFRPVVSSFFPGN